MFRKDKTDLEVLLVHPGGPYFQRKDDGAWTIPKGEAGEGEDLLARAIIEFEQDSPCMGFRRRFEADFKLLSNTFEMEWPPRSGRMQQFSEVDRAGFFALAEARRKINVAQRLFLDRLLEALGSRKSGES